MEVSDEDTFTPGRVLTNSRTAFSAEIDHEDGSPCAPLCWEAASTYDVMAKTRDNKVWFTVVSLQFIDFMLALSRHCRR